VLVTAGADALPAPGARADEAAGVGQFAGSGAEEPFQATVQQLLLALPGGQHSPELEGRGGCCGVSWRGLRHVGEALCTASICRAA